MAEVEAIATRCHNTENSLAHQVLKHQVDVLFAPPIDLRWHFDMLTGIDQVLAIVSVISLETLKVEV